MTVFFVKVSQAQTDGACGPGDDAGNCLVEFLFSPEKFEAPAFGCFHVGEQTWKPVPIEWGCSNPVNTPSWLQPEHCLCSEGYEVSEARYLKAASLALPVSIPASRLATVLGTMSEEDKLSSYALRDWYSCGWTVDALNFALNEARAEIEKLKKELASE